jgi:hypothetical protein
MGAKKKRKRFDKHIMAQGDDTLTMLYSQYEKMANPATSFADQQIIRVQQDITEQKKNASENLKMLTEQEDQKMRMMEGQSARTYQDLVRSSQEEMERQREVGAQEAVDARTAGAADIFTQMTQEGMGGLAGTGERNRKSISAQARRTMAKVNLGLKQQLEQTQDTLARQDTERKAEIESGRLGMQQSVDTARQNFTQQTSTLDRQLANETAKLMNDKLTGLDRIRMEAMGVISSTMSSFQDAGSAGKWNPVGDSKEPHAEMNKFDEQFGISTGFEELE